jgi:hypothetical protein
MPGEQEDLGFMSVSDLSAGCVARLQACEELRIAVGCGVRGDCRLMGMPGCGFLIKTEVQIYTKPAVGTQGLLRRSNATRGSWRTQM